MFLYSILFEIRNAHVHSIHKLHIFNFLLRKLIRYTYYYGNINVFSSYETGTFYVFTEQPLPPSVFPCYFCKKILLIKSRCFEQFLNSGFMIFRVSKKMYKTIRSIRRLRALHWRELPDGWISIKTDSTIAADNSRLNVLFYKTIHVSQVIFFPRFCGVTWALCRIRIAAVKLFCDLFIMLLPNSCCDTISADNVFTRRAFVILRKINSIMHYVSFHRSHFHRHISLSSKTVGQHPTSGRRIIGEHFV